ncbi:MAG: hypothetical protein ACRCZF_06490 [Gemmataceae bacterium]
MIRKMFAALAVATLVVGVVSAAEITSGPQPGAMVGAFKPMHATGESAGEKSCLVCKYGDAPVVMVFARCTQCEGTQTLIKKIEEATKTHSKCELSSFVVFLSDDEKIGDNLKAYGKKLELKNVVLSYEASAGPAKMNINKDADVTVVLYTEHKVKANHAFKKGTLDEKGVDAVIKDLTKILPEEK